MADWNKFFTKYVIIVKLSYHLIAVFTKHLKYTINPNLQFSLSCYLIWKNRWYFHHWISYNHKKLFMKKKNLYNENVNIVPHFFRNYKAHLSLLRAQIDKFPLFQFFSHVFLFFYERFLWLVALMGNKLAKKLHFCRRRISDGEFFFSLF